MKSEGALNWEVLSSSWAACGWWEISSWRLPVVSTAWCKHCQCCFKPIGINARKNWKNWNDNKNHSSSFNDLSTWRVKYNPSQNLRSVLPHHRSVLVRVHYLSQYRLGKGKGGGRKMNWGLLFEKCPGFHFVFPLRLFTELCYSSAKEKRAEFSPWNLYDHHFLVYLMSLTKILLLSEN